MNAAVALWLKDPPVGPAVVHIAMRKWVGGVGAKEIAQDLMLSDRRELYQLRAELGWPTRNPDWSKCPPKGPPKLKTTYTPAERDQAERMWYAGEPAKVIAGVLHLAKRHQVYIVAQRERWEARSVRPPRAEWRATLDRQEIRGHLENIQTGFEPIRPEEVGRRQRAPRKVSPLLPRVSLGGVCPTCTYRVAPDPDHATLVGETWYHAQCAPAGVP